MTRRDLADGESVEVMGNHGVYTVKRTRGVYSCSCPAWRFQSLPIDQRTCKHITSIIGEDADKNRLAASPERERVPVNVKDGTTLQPTRKIEFSAGEEPGAGEEPPASVQFMLAEAWDEKLDPTGYWMSEKLDGVRARWIAGARKFISRQGNEFFAPEWFTKGFPPFDLDGELWGGRGKFQQTVSIVRSANSGDAWKEIRYAVFDAPAIDEIFEVRIGVIKKFFTSFPDPRVVVLDQVACTGREHLIHDLDTIIKIGGEGIILRQPNSKYTAGRSAAILKVKPKRDAEARVIVHVPGRGKYVGMVGALKVEAPDGRKFSVGSGLSDADRRSPPPVGSVITYQYQELTDAGIPRFPRFSRVRTDVSWSDLTAAVSKKSIEAVPASRPEKLIHVVAPRLPAEPAKPAADGDVFGPDTVVVSEKVDGSRISIQFVDGAPKVRAPSPSNPAAKLAAHSIRSAPRSPEPGVRYPTADGILYKYEYNNDSANAHKFWTVRVDGRNYTASWGRIGTAGQSQTKPFPSPAEAVKEASKKRLEKEREGYHLVSSS